MGKLCTWSFHKKNAKLQSKWYTGICSPKILNLLRTILPIILFVLQRKEFFLTTMQQFFQGLKFKGNIYWAMILRLSLAMLLFSVCRIGFYLYNIEFFPDISFVHFLRLLWGGLRFDLTTVLYVNALMIVLTILPLDFRFKSGYQKFIQYSFYFFNGAAAIANLADFAYYKFTLRRTTADVFNEFAKGPDEAVFFRFIFDYWHVTVFFIGLMWLMVFLYTKIKVEGPMLKNRTAYYTLGLLAIPITLALFIGAVRGGFRHSTRPITLSNAGEYVKHPNETNIVLNTPFSIIRTIGKTKIQKVNYFDNEEELAALYNPIHTPVDTISFKPDNVVVILLESFSREFMGAYHKDKPDFKGYTPFLDSLIQHSKTFEHSFSNGRKSIDGLPATTASIPTFGVPFVLTAYSNNRFNSLASLLKDKGYYTAFFTGHPNGAMGFSSYTTVAKFDQYVGMNEYGNSDDYDGMWGIWDHKFIPFFAERISEFREPFFAALFTLSSHHPFKVPKEFDGKFKGGKEPILRCIEYTDYALKEFFKKISVKPWYKNTLFVITADHCSSNILFDESRANPGLFSVPIIFFKPDNSLANRENEIIQHIDIMPSVLGYLHYDKPYFAFGRDVFREKQLPIAFNYRDAYNLYTGEYLLSFNGQKTVGLYKFTEDKLLTQDLKEINVDIVVQMEQQLKAIIQQYNNRMIDNRLMAN
jgi:phosphoglycerol transferase MdoB-like AlkP superfamily enzyme